MLRHHVDAILKENDTTPLVVYGDFNDTRSTPSLKLILGKYQSPTGLTAILLKDSHQETWTQFWSLNDIYSRFDFIMVNQALEGQIDSDTSVIIDDPDWSEASDHRPVMATFR